MNLKEKLEYHYLAFDKTRISPDPLEFLHRFENEQDIEAAGFISAVFAYGNVKQIINTLERIFVITEGKPFRFISDLSPKDAIKLKELKHRFYKGNDIAVFFSILNNIYAEHGSLRKFFIQFYNDKEPNLKNAINSFSYNMVEYASEKTDITNGLKFMFPLPSLGSACKRMNLFLRWMVRKDELDFGIWKEISPSKLVIPVDTHIARICQELKLTSLKNVSWKMAEDITDNLRKFDPDDPVKYDFAICHIGMRKLKF
jgi:uncharacterized protein (TIGR02757 family)